MSGSPHLFFAQWLFTAELLVSLLYVFTILTAVVVVILDKRDPTKAMLWVVVLVMLPIAGLLLYFFFGQNLRRRHIFKRKKRVDNSYLNVETFSHCISYVDSESSLANVATYRHVAQLLVNNSLAPVISGNAVKLFHEGVSAFEQLIADLEGARELIHMEYFIFRADRLGRHIAEILKAKARAGIDVRLIYDAVGSWGIPKSFIRDLRAAGVQIYPFQRVIFPYLSSRLNYRNHRKILVIDGTIAHMGGMNVADKYISGDPVVGQWHDTQMRIEGPAVSALHLVFLTDWAFVSRSPYSFTPLDFTQRTLPGHTALQITNSGPDSDWAAIMQSFFLAISKASKHIYITTPYFVPNESILTALRTAALSGIDVRILLPFKSDSRFVLWATFGYISTLLEAGIRVFLFQGGFNHSKIMMIDGNLATVGSANMDIRSFEDSFEVAAFIYDSELTAQLEAIFLRDTLQSKEIDLEDWVQRTFWNRMRHSFARLFSPLF